MTWCVYLTHPEVRIDPEVPVPDWGLSEIGRAQATHAAELPFAREIRHVVSSADTKAVETAAIFAVALGLPVRTVAAMHENDRSATGFLPPPEFEMVADAFFAEPDHSVRGWERAIDARARIVAAVKTALTELPDADPVLFAGHGAVGTLLKCHLLGSPISRAHDQTGGGHWYRFEKAALARQDATGLAWIRL